MLEDRLNLEIEDGFEIQSNSIVDLHLRNIKKIGLEPRDFITNDNKLIFLFDNMRLVRSKSNFLRNLHYNVTNIGIEIILQ